MYVYRAELFWGRTVQTGGVFTVYTVLGGGVFTVYTVLGTAWVISTWGQLGINLVKRST